MIHPVSQVRTAVRGARFDPRTVLVGLVLLFLAALSGFALAGLMATKTDALITPVAQLCRANTATSIDLTTSGACGAAADARQVGPVTVTQAGAPGDDGSDGTDGRDGTDGVDGVSIPGRDGTNGTNGTNGLNGADGDAGADGVSPACLAEPMACRGADGRDGTNGVDGADGKDGTNGADGADGRDGSAVASQTYTLPDGRVFTCARTGGTDLDPMYRCQDSSPPPPPPSENPEPEPEVQ